MTEELKPLSKKHQAFVDQYFLCHFNGTEAYMRVYKPNSRAAAAVGASDLLRIPKISAEIEARMSTAHMGADEALEILAEIGRADMGVFYKVIDEWMFSPLPSYEILDEKEVEREKDDGTKEKVTAYRVRHVALDMDKVIDPRYSHLIHEFKDSRRSGLSIKTYNKHDAARDVLKIHGKFTDKVELEIKDELTDDERIARLTALLDAARARRDGQTPK